MAVNPLDIDPKNLGYEFSKEWLAYTESRPQKFVVLWLKKTLESIRQTLEKAEGNDLIKQQGMARQVRQIILLLESKNVETQLKEVLAFLETYGN